MNKSHLFSGIFLLLFVPQVVFAAWWNPLTWRVFSWIKISPPQEQGVTATTSATTIKLVEIKNVPQNSPSKKPVSNKIIPVQTGTLCNGIYYSDCPTGNQLVCPTNGDKASCQPLPNAAPTQTYTPQKTQQDIQAEQNQIKDAKAAALMQEYNLKVAAIDQQILNIQQQYYKDAAAIERQPIDLIFQQNQKQKAAIEAQAKIDQLNSQKEQLRLDYLNKLYQL